MGSQTNKSMGDVISISSRKDLLASSSKLGLSGFDKDLGNRIGRGSHLSCISMLVAMLCKKKHVELLGKFGIAIFLCLRSVPFLGFFNGTERNTKNFGI